MSTGNVVITSPFDDAGGTDAGAVYLFNGATGALISTLTGSTANDRVGFHGVTALSNGNYVVSSALWNNGAATDAGAATFGNGTGGTSGAVSAANSLVGSTAGDNVGFDGVTALSNGNYVVSSPFWNNGAVIDAGAVTFGNGTTGISGVIDDTNSAIGLTSNTDLRSVVVDDTNSTFFGRFLAEGGGRVRVGSQVDGFAPTVPDPVLDAGAAAGDNMPDAFLVRLDGADLIVLLNGAEIFRQALSETNSLTINGSGDADTVTVDFSFGDFDVPGTFNGAGGADTSIVLSNATTNEQVSLRADGVQLDGINAIAFTAVEASYFYGQPGDSALLFDSTGTDFYVSDGSYSYMAGLDDDTFRLASGVGFAY
ncbi:MAG: hypothetical protein ACREJB_09880, partial [Planctomycetaceae bacterium]